MRIFKFFFPTLLLVVFIYVLDRSWGTVPPIGKLFSPFHGYLVHVEGADTGRKGEFALPGLNGQVTVHYDEQGVPHIFAENDYDLYYAQGYVTAKDRLWQMDFQVLAAAGRLTEVVGEAALPLDQYNRRIGMAKTAQAVIDRMVKEDSLTHAVLQAYADGVNDYIASLSPRQYPIEYKLLNYAPEQWSPYRSILMLMNMRHDLSAGTNDYRLTNLLLNLGEQEIDNLFPFYPDRESPIMPDDTKWEFEPSEIPAVPAQKSAFDGLNNPMATRIDAPSPTPQIGSNNWAIGGVRSITGLPILSNDPHLRLSLPSIWYQTQLSAPGVNVYGVSLPGTPTIIIGFNKDIAWGVTNVGLDVLDFYKIQFKDEERSQYWYEGAWKEIERREEVYHIKGGGKVIDTLLFSHHGPIVYQEETKDQYKKDIPVGYAMRWIGNEEQTTDLLTFYYLNRSENYDDYREALSYFTAPAQNFVFASNENDIAITSNGKLPIKWKGQGRYLLDGSVKEHEWAGWIPFQHNPTVKNPDRGFVSSANQFPTNLTYPYYLDWSFAHPSRGIRINEVLESTTNADKETLRDLLNDNLNIDARLILPDLLPILAASDSVAQMPEFQALSAWNWMNDPNEVGASIYEAWVDELRVAIWKDDLKAEGPVMYPSLDRTFSLLLNEPDAKWFDDQSTDEILETKDDIVRQSFVKTIQKLTEKHGEFEADAWQWHRVKNTTISHLVPNFTMFSRTSVPNGGGPGIVNATTGRHGPSWRMVVALDKEWPDAVGLFPGGQSGNPGSPYYDNLIDLWANGELPRLFFMKNEEDTSNAIQTTLKLKPKK